MLVCSVIANSGSWAASVVSGTSVDFMFDVSGLGNNISIPRFDYACNTADTTLCSPGAALTDGDYLATGGSIRFVFGRTQGSDDLGTRFFTNPFPNPISNVGISGSSLRDIEGAASPLPIPDTLATLWVRVMYENDAFGITRFRLSGTGFSLTGQEFASVSAVPVPAALPLFASALGLAGLFGYRRKKPAVP